MTNKKGWAAKLKEEVADLKQKNKELEATLLSKGVTKKIYQTVVWSVLSFIAGAIIF